MTGMTELAVAYLAFIGLIGAYVYRLLSRLVERLLDGLEGSRALQYLTGLLCITIGALIYLANPMYGNDWLSFVLGILGGLTAVEGLLLLAVPDRVIPFAWRLLEKAGRIGPGASVAIGLALFLAGAVRV